MPQSREMPYFKYDKVDPTSGRVFVDSLPVFPFVSVIVSKSFFVLIGSGPIFALLLDSVGKNSKVCVDSDDE